MNRIYKISPLKITSLLFSALLIAISHSSICSAEVINNSHWLVKPGDSVYGIARKMHPDNAKLQSRFRRELVTANPEIFKGNANLMSVGTKLVLPGFAISKPKPVQITKPVKQSKPKQKKAMQQTLIAKAVTPGPEDVIGKVVINIGELKAENRGSSRRLKRHSAIYKGDTLKTLSRTHTQIRLKDGALISLSANTHLQIAEYNFNGKEDGSEKSIFNLIKGGFRTITGLIGHKNKQNYQVKTSVATIGIRGTHYGLMLCDSGSCEKEEGLKDGLYGGVVDGSITTENKTGVHQFTNDQYFHIASLNTPPIETLAPPPVFNTKKPQKKTLKGPHDPRGADQKPPGDPMMLGGPNPNMMHPPIFDINNDGKPPLPPNPDLSNTTPDNIPSAPAGSGYLYAFNSSPNGVFTGSAITGQNQNDNILITSYNDGRGPQPVAASVHESMALPSQLPRNITANISDIPSNLAEFSFATSINSPSGGTTDIKVNWGRWNASKIIVKESKNEIFDNDLHFVFSPDLTPIATIKNISGSRTYSTIVGNTMPTDNMGNIGASALSFTIDVDFTNQFLTEYTVSTTVNSINYTGTASGIPLENLTTGFQILAATGCGVSVGECNGQANLNFIGPAADGAITSYTIHSISTGTTVSGAAVVEISGM